MRAKNDTPELAINVKHRWRIQPLPWRDLVSVSCDDVLAVQPGWRTIIYLDLGFVLAQLLMKDGTTLYILDYFTNSYFHERNSTT